MSAVSFITSLARKLLARESKGITTIPNRMAVEQKAGEIAAILQDAGLPLNRADEFIKSEQDLVRILNLIESTPPVMREVPSGIRSTKSAKIMDMEGKEIDPRSKIMGGKQSETEAEIAERLGRENKETVQRIKNRKLIEEAIDNVSPGFVKGDKKYNAEIVAEEIANKRGLDYYDMDAKQRAGIYGEAFDALTDMDNFAQGGRAGYKFGIGPLLKRLSQKSPKQAYTDYLKSVKDRAMTDPKKLAPEVGAVAATGIFINRRMKDVLENMKNQDMENNLENFIKELDADPFYQKYPELKDKTIEAYTEMMFGEKRAQGGRAGFKEGNKKITIDAVGSKSGKQQIMGAPKGITADRESIDAIIKADIPISEKIDLLAKYQYGKGRTRIERDGQEIFLDEGGFKSRDIGLGFNKEGEGIGGTLTYNLESGEPEFNIGFRKTFNEGGRIGFAKGLSKILLGRRDFLKTMFGNTKKNRKNRKLQELIEEYRELQKSMEKNPQFKFPKTGDPEFDDMMLDFESKLAKDRVKSAAGGRIGFKDGMTRRTFMKILGGAMAIPIIGKFLKPMKVGKTVTKVPMIKTADVPGKPEWFDQLVNKVITEGDDMTKQFATKEREIVHATKIDEDNFVIVTQDLDEGAVRVEYQSDANVFGETVQLQYKKPLPDESVPNPKAEFTTAESGPVGRQVGPDDYDIEVDEVGGTSIRDLDSDVSKLKEYATGQKPTMKELVQNIERRKKAQRITDDPEAQSDALIRRQGEAFPDTPDQDFASGGIARMLGE